MTRNRSTSVDAAPVALSDGKASPHTPVAEIVEGASPAWNTPSNHDRPEKTIKETGNKEKSVANHSAATEIDSPTSSGVSQTSSGKWVRFTLISFLLHSVQFILVTDGFNPISG